MSSLLPSIASLGLWGYWVIGLMAFGEAFVLTSVFSPGTVVVVLGGALAAEGLYDIFDMMWFVAIGTILRVVGELLAEHEGGGAVRQGPRRPVSGTS